MNDKLTTNNSPLAIKVVPALRFPEFSGDWVEKLLSEVAKIERGRFSPRPRNNPIYYGGDIPFVQTSDIVNSNGRVSSYSQTLNQEGLKVSKLFPKGTILITIAANIGYAGVLQIDMACPDSLIGIKCESSVFNDFLNILLEIEQPKMDYLAVSAAQKNINIEFLKPYRFNFPDIQEQKKIASFLTSVDTKIEQLGKKKALLEKYKKGMMQKLFSQALRFKDELGNEFPDWEEGKLGDIARFINGRAFKQTELLEQGKYPVLRVGNFFSNNSWYYSELELGVDKYCDDGDLLYAWSASFGPKIWEGGKTIYHYHIWKVINGERIEKKFLYHILDNETLKIKTRAANGFALLHITKGLIEGWEVCFPCICEQQKITNLFSTLDKKIDQITTELNQAKTFKKGLLQQMFV